MMLVKPTMQFLSCRHLLSASVCRFERRDSDGNLPRFEGFQTLLATLGKYITLFLNGQVWLLLRQRKLSSLVDNLQSSSVCFLAARNHRRG